MAGKMAKFFGAQDMTVGNPLHLSLIHISEPTRP